MWRAAVTLLHAVPGVSAWVTLAQQHYGAQVDEWILESKGTTGISDKSAQAQLYLSRGQLWNMPDDPESTHGLGGGIAYAWDPKLCDLLLPRMRENVMNLISCADLKASLQRGFDAWAINNRFIKFIDVSSACQQQYTLTQDCPLAEVWVSALSCTFVSALCPGAGPSNTGALTWAAAATPKYALTDRFRFTNGQYNKLGSAYRRTIEITGGVLLFNVGTPDAPGMCWYMDSAFCSGFHSMKLFFPGDNAASKAANARVVISVIFYVIWVTSLLFFIYSMFYLFFPRSDFWETLEDAVDGGVITKEERIALEEAKKKYWANMLKRLAKYETLNVATIITMMVGLPLVYYQLFLPCWDCYDFEGAAVHEAGHLLGMGHPDAFPATLPSWSTNPGSNVYNGLLAGGRLYNQTSCVSNWNWVKNGTPADAVLEDTGVRNAVMESFTQNNPSQCLSVDDAEGLQTLYPDCQGYWSSTPNCIKVNLNFGIVRILLYLGVPLIVVSWVVLVFDYFVDEYVRVPDQGQMKTRMKKSDRIIGNINKNGELTT